MTTPIRPVVRILGVDPGSVVTGFGLIETDGRASVHVTHGHIRTGGADFAMRLGCIYRELGAVLDEWRPDEVAIEQVFLSQNPMSALKLGQARGAAIAAVVARSLPVAEYAPRAVKQTVTGHGGAEKAQVQNMVRSLLSITRAVQVDAADGLAIALCHAHSRCRLRAPLVAASRRRGRGRGLRR